MNFNKEKFTTSGSWIVPEGVTSVIVYAFGGGGAGNAGDNGGNFGSGGNSAAAQTGILDVTPGDTLSVAIGAGGTGPSTNSGPAPDGQSTMLMNGATSIFAANGGAGSYGQFAGGFAAGLLPEFSQYPGAGGAPGNWPALPAYMNAYLGGVQGMSVSGGGGGGMGPAGNGGNGGNGATTGNGGSGQNAPANSGAGGGGGGGTTDAGALGGIGGNGGSGYLVILW